MSPILTRTFSLTKAELMIILVALNEVEPFESFARNLTVNNLGLRFTRAYLALREEEHGK